ncbi:MAG TPA: N-acetyltransferase [Bacilli bacterium]|nr:N-acetyltransferase [Bacilli bacterium]
MRYHDTGVYEELSTKTFLVQVNHQTINEYRLEDFDCGVADYNEFLRQDALLYSEEHLSAVYLLIHRQSHDVLGYFAVSADSFLLEQEEKAKVGLDIPFSTVPAVKIGKWATSRYHIGKYGSYLLYLALGIAREVNRRGVACRFLSVDADIEFNERTPEFYRANGFVFNEHRQYRKRSSNRSMRYDLFDFV